MADILVIYPWKVAFARVPKAANSSVKEVIAQKLELPQIDDLPTTKDRYWTDVAKEKAGMVTTSTFALDPLFREFYCFSIVRKPTSRLVSCYKNKIIRNARPSPGFRKLGYYRGMPFEEFVRRACGETDDCCDIHLRSQHTMICHDERPLAQTVIDMDDLGKRWTEVTSAIQAKAGVDLGKLPQRNSTSRVQADVELTPELESLVRKRYAKDYSIFFSHL